MVEFVEKKVLDNLCKVLVTAHSGNIWISSEIYKGSVFYFHCTMLQKRKNCNPLWIK